MNSHGYGFLNPQSIHHQYPSQPPQNYSVPIPGGAHYQNAPSAAVSVQSLYDSNLLRQQGLVAESSGSSNTVNSSLGSTQNIAAGVPQSIFFNLGITSPNLVDILPVPTGTKHATLEDPQTREQSERLLSQPSPSLVQRVVQHLSQISFPSPKFRAKKSKANGEVSANSSGPHPSIPLPSNLEMYIHQMNPSVISRQSSKASGAPSEYAVNQDLGPAAQPFQFASSSSVSASVASPARKPKESRPAVQSPASVPVSSDAARRPEPAQSISFETCRPIASSSNMEPEPASEPARKVPSVTESPPFDVAQHPGAYSEPEGIAKAKHPVTASPHKTSPTSVQNAGNLAYPESPEIAAVPVSKSTRTTTLKPSLESEASGSRTNASVLIQEENALMHEDVPIKTGRDAVQLVKPKPDTVNPAEVYSDAGSPEIAPTPKHKKTPSKAPPVVSIGRSAPSPKPKQPTPATMHPPLQTSTNLPDPPRVKHKQSAIGSKSANIPVDALQVPGPSLKLLSAPQDSMPAYIVHPQTSAPVERVTGEEPRQRIKMVFRFKEINEKKNAQKAAEADENQQLQSEGVKRSTSPEIPEQQAANKSIVEDIKDRTERPAAAKVVTNLQAFDASKLSMTWSAIDFSTASKVFKMAMAVGPKKARFAKSLSASSSSLSPSTSCSSPVIRTKETRTLLPYSPESSDDHPALRSFLATRDRVMQHISKCDMSSLAAVDPDAEITDADIPGDAVIPQSEAENLASDTAKLKAHDQARLVPLDQLKHLLVAILPTILHGAVVPTDLIGFAQDEEMEPSLYREILTHRTLRGAEAAIAALNIMTSPHLPRDIFNPEIIEACVRFAKYHSVHTIYPVFDPLYRYEAQAKDGFVSKIKQKRARSGQTKENGILRLYSRFEDLIMLFAELVQNRVVTEAPMHQLASLGVSAFLVENIRDLQLKSLSLVANIFSRYEKHRDPICEDILSSLARLPSSKRNLRSYVVTPTENIQMISALILHLVQSIARLPSKRQLMQRNDGRIEDYEATILVSYDESNRCAKHILSTFFTKCATKGEEDFRPLFENFILDLLVTMNKPEWPAAESMLEVLGFILRQKLNDRQLDANFRHASIDYLGLITARMRKDSLVVKDNPEQTQNLLTKLYEVLSLSDEGMMDVSDAMPKDDHLFQQGLLHYIWRSVPAPTFAANYYLAQWYHDAANGTLTSFKDDDSDDGETPPSVEETLQSKADVVEFMKIAVDPARWRTRSDRKVVDQASADFIARHFAIRRPFARSFNTYFRKILSVASDNSMQMRIRAFKAVGSVIDSDGSLMGRKDVRSLVESRMLDTSAMIRDTVVEMIGTYARTNPEHIQQYYEVLQRRLMDTAPSVRKKAIRVLHDFCVENPNHSLCAPICANIIKRMNDNEENIKKLVYEVFEFTWFNAGIKDASIIARRVDQIVEVVWMLENETTSATEWFEKMVKDLLKREASENSKTVQKACRTIVDHIVKKLLSMDVELDRPKEETQNICACFLTLHLIGKCSPELLLGHVQSFPQFLNHCLNSLFDQKIVSWTANILTMVVPLMKNPPDFFLSQIEESCVGLFMKARVNIQILQANVECLAAVVNGVTHNYAIIRDIYERFWRILGTSSENAKDQSAVANLQRGICVLALIIQHFDIEAEEFGYVQGGTERLLENFLSLLRHPVPSIQVRALQSLGFVFIRKPENMLQKKYSDVYGAMLTAANKNTETKKIVLQNLVKYLEHEESQVLQIEEHSSATEQYAALDLKGNQSAVVELPRRVVFHFLKMILESGLDSNMEVRKEVLNLVSIVVRLRMCHPQQVLPFLIAISTDPNASTSSVADTILEEISRKYHSSAVVATKALIGIKESFAFHKSLQQDQLIRGFHKSELTSLVGNVYTYLRSDRAQRRTLINAMLDVFKYKDSDLDQLLYFADNIAFFAYQFQDEPHFVIHQIEPILAMISPDALHRFRKAFKLTSAAPPPDDPEQAEGVDEDDLETVENLRQCIPEDLSELRQCYRVCQASMLLIILKRFLASTYGITPVKAREYSPSEPKQVYEKPITVRKTGVKYEPTSVCEFVSRDMKGDLGNYVTPQLLIRKFLEFKNVVQLIDEREGGSEIDPTRTVGSETAEIDPDMEDDEVLGELPTLDPDTASDTSSAPSPSKKRKAEDVFKKPFTPKKRNKPDSDTPKRGRGRPRKNENEKATPKKRLKTKSRSTSDSDDEGDDTWSP